MYGCRVIQKALESIDPDEQLELLKELEGSVLKCIKDQNGNREPLPHSLLYVWFFRRDSESDWACGSWKTRIHYQCFQGRRPQHGKASKGVLSFKFVILLWSEKFRDIWDLASHLGHVSIYSPLWLSRDTACFRTLYRGAETSSPWTDSCQHPRVDCRPVWKLWWQLMNGHLNNIQISVVQHVIERGSDEDRDRIIEQIKGKVMTYAQHKFSSNVIEKCLTCGNNAHKTALITEACGE